MSKDESNVARSALMRKVRSRDTGPEMIVRRLLHRRVIDFGFTQEIFRRPDIVFRGRRKAIFVHGCFWHRHEGCKRTTTPKIRREFWTDKFASNRKRDTAAVSSLEQKGWEVVIVWECETKDAHRLEHRLVSLLGFTRISPAFRYATS